MSDSMAEPEPIVTLPPIDEIRRALPISTITGQPRRSKVMATGVGLLLASSTAAAVSLGIAWWDAIHVENWPNATNLIRWLHPDAGTWQSVVLVCGMGAIGATMSAAPAVAAFNAWNGHRWSRWAGLIACGIVAALAVLMNWQAWIALPLAALGALMLFLPPVSRYFDHWAAYRAPRPSRELSNEPVFYGPLARYR